MTILRLHNTKTRAKEVFTPIDAGNIRLYLCGPTVYDRAHIGNARNVVVFDILVRLLRRMYPRVTYVRNITDIDDKINARAAALGQPIDVVTAGPIRAYHEDMAALFTLPPDIEPRATGHIAQMIEITERLLAPGWISRLISAIPGILCCGNPRPRICRAGRAPGGAAGRAGRSSARR